eukprot:evm.model.scf_3150.1 EVM.evm.TU.scf_3150.1   scf_3150:4091-4828(+)
MVQSAKEIVSAAVGGNKVMVFSKTFCPYCRKAKQALLSILEAGKVTIMELDERDDGDAIQDELLSLTGGRSVPRVFIDGKFIGGGDDTARMAASGELKNILTDKGIL